jgi:hypothetical protein
MDREPLYEHDDEAIHRRRVDPGKNAHREEVRVGSANASTRCRGRGGGEFHRRNECCWTFVHGQKGAFNMLTSSQGLRALRNNKISCSKNKLISKRRVMPTAPTPAVQQSCLPRSKQPTRSKACYDSLYGPQAAVSSRPL